MFQCLPCLYIALFDKVPEEEKAKYHPLTRFALMALARKKEKEGVVERVWDGKQEERVSMFSSAGSTVI